MLLEQASGHRFSWGAPASSFRSNSKVAGVLLSQPSLHPSCALGKHWAASTLLRAVGNLGRMPKAGPYYVWAHRWKGAVPTLTEVQRTVKLSRPRRSGHYAVISALLLPRHRCKPEKRVLLPALPHSSHPLLPTPILANLTKAQILSVLSSWKTIWEPQVWGGAGMVRGPTQKSSITNFGLPFSILLSVAM